MSQGEEKKMSKKRRRSRAPEYRMPECIDASLEYIADVVLGTKPKKNKRYLIKQLRGR